MIRFKNNNPLNLNLTKVLTCIAVINFFAGISNIKEFVNVVLTTDFLIAFIITLYILSGFLSLIFVIIAEGIKSKPAKKYITRLGIMILLILIYELIIKQIFKIDFSIWNDIILKYWWNRYDWQTIGLVSSIICALGLIKIKIRKNWFSLFFNSNEKLYVIGTFNILSESDERARNILSFPTSITGKR